jgi:hypothetical protein
MRGGGDFDALVSTNLIPPPPKAMFARFDADANGGRPTGEVSFSDFSNALRAAHPSKTEARINALLKSIRREHNGRTPYSEETGLVR